MSLHRPYPGRGGPASGSGPAEGSGGVEGAGGADGDGDLVIITPAAAGWTYCGLRVVELAPGVPREVSTGDSELFVVPLSGGCQVAVAGEERFTLNGRDSVFTRITDFA